MSFQSLPGFRDFYPDDLAARNHITGCWREMARRLIPRFAEVQLRCPRPVSAERESRQRWATPVPGGPAVPDVVLHYEEAVAPELVLDTGARSVEACVEEIVHLAWRLERSEAAAVDAAFGRE